MKEAQTHIPILLLLIFSILTVSFYSVNKETEIEIKYLLGQVIPAKDSNFVKIEKEFTHKENIYLEKRTYAAFIQMYDSAKADGIDLKIISAFRSFKYQKWLWERKWTGRKTVNGKNLSVEYPNPQKRAKEILKYSAMPGTSRHHWGTDIDLNSVSDKYFKTKKGMAVYEWLKNNASKFGFCQTYSTKGESRKTGYEEEKWHWSYVQVARKYLDYYKKQITYNHLIGFKGSQTAKELNVIKDYVVGINSECE